MSREEIQEMIDILMEVGTEKYQYFKYMILLSSKKDRKVNKFFRELFAYTDKNRALLLEMKESVA